MGMIQKMTDKKLPGLHFTDCQVTAPADVMNFLQAIFVRILLLVTRKNKQM